MPSNLNNQPDPFLVHEALDRCHVINCLLDDHLIQHPFVQQDAEVFKLLCAVSDAVAAAYQLIGGFKRQQEFHEMFDQDPNEQANISGADFALMVDELKQVTKQRDELMAASQWQPIETAPKDGTAVLGKLIGSDIPIPVRMLHGNWVVSWDLHHLSEWDGPTHWMSLPNPPAIASMKERP